MVVHYQSLQVKCNGFSTSGKKSNPKKSSSERSERVIFLITFSATSAESVASRVVICNATTTSDVISIASESALLWCHYCLGFGNYKPYFLVSLVLIFRIWSWKKCFCILTNFSFFWKPSCNGFMEYHYKTPKPSCNGTP